MRGTPPDQRSAHNTWILDDGRNPALRDAAARMGVGYQRRQTNAHARAGNVNVTIARTTGRFIPVLDADHVPRPDLLTQTVPHLIANPSVVARRHAGGHSAYSAMAAM